MTPNRAVHRRLRLISPHMRGPDVRALQGRINAELGHRDLGWRKIATDGELGRQTIGAAFFTAFVIGLSRSRLKAVRAGRVTEEVQHLLRNPEDRSRRDRLRERLRRGRVAKLRHAHNGPARVLEWMRSKVGTTESPPGSNWGPEIGEWIRFTGYSGPVYWCGCFACFAVVAIGKAKVPVPSRMGYGPYIVDDARNGANGFHAVPVEDAQAGDVFVYWGGEHIGVCAGPTRSGVVHAVEGNTSSDAGSSQSNGGGVFEKRRSVSDVTVCARPEY